MVTLITILKIKKKSNSVLIISDFPDILATWETVKEKENLFTLFLLFVVALGDFIFQ